MADDGLFRSLLGGSGGEYTWVATDFDRLTPATFETTIGALFTAEGYDVEHPGPTAERGFDLIAHKSGLIRSKTTVIAVIQPGGTVSPATVEQLEHARTINGAATGVIVRPAPFDGAVRDAIYDAKNIDFLTGTELIDRLTAANVPTP